jgi:hypothetical protein
VQIHHLVGTSACPHPMLAVTLRNDGIWPLDWQAQPTEGFAATPGSGSLEPGESVSIVPKWTCDQAVRSVDGALQVIGLVPGTDAMAEATVPLILNLYVLAVQLDHALGPFPAGTFIELSRITDYLLVSQYPGCPHPSLREANGKPGIIIDGVHGPFPNPAPDRCSYGRAGPVLKPR